MEKKESMISEKVAQDQLNIFLDYYDIENDESDESPEGIAITTACKKVIKYIQDGLIIIVDEGESIKVTQKLCKSKTIMTYSIMSGRHKIAMDKNTNNNNFKRMYQLIASLTSLPIKTIEDLKGKDLKVVEYLSVLFISA